MKNDMFMQLRPESSHHQDQTQGLTRLERKVDELFTFLEPIPSQAPPSETAPAGLLTYWTALKRRKFIVLFSGVVVAAAAWYVSQHMPKLYRAHVSMEFLEPDRGSMNVQNFSKMGESFMNQETYLQTQVSLLNSKTLLRRVGQRLVAAKVIEPADLQRFDDPSASSTTSASEPSEQTDPVLGIDKITVLPIRGTRLVEISYSAKSPKLAAAIANSIADEYIQQDVDNRVNTAEQTRAWLQKQLEDSKEKLQASEVRLQKYAKSSGLLYTSPKGNAAEETENKLEFLAHDLSEAQAKRAGLEAKYKTLAGSPNSKLDDADSASLRDIQSRLLDLERQRAALASQFTPNYFKVKELDAQIQTLRDGESKEYNRWLSQLHSAYETEVTHQQLLEDAYKEQTEVVSDQASKAISYNVLKREVETNRNLYDSLLAGMKEAGVNAAARVPNARVVDPAEPPLRPYSPRPVQTGAVGLLAGLMLGAAFVLMKETGDSRVKGPGMAQSYLNVPELGVIPSTKPHLLPTARHAAVVNGVQGRNVRFLGGLMRNDPRYLGSPVFEAFHAVVTSILSPGRATNVPRVLLVTSGALHEGKSTVIGNMALMAAQIGQRVILVDGDLRNPRLHQIYHVPNDNGLSDLLEQDSLSENWLAANIQETQVPGLSLLPSGPVPESVATLLHSPRLAEIVGQLRVDYDLVLIDTPPVLPFADARIFGKLADAVVLVVRAGQTTREVALAAKAKFTEDGLLVFGSILNDWNGREALYEYGGDYRR